MSSSNAPARKVAPADAQRNDLNLAHLAARAREARAHPVRSGIKSIGSPALLPFTRERPRRPRQWIADREAFSSDSSRAPGFPRC